MTLGGFGFEGDHGGMAAPNPKLFGLIDAAIGLAVVAAGAAGSVTRGVARGRHRSEGPCSSAGAH